VQVCPTGIDIRNGLQNECIACAACIDVCDDVMGKMGYAQGLIRYSSGNAIAKSWSPAQMLRRVWRPRVLIYGALLAGMGLAFVLSLSLRQGFVVDVIKDRGAMARVVGHGAVENVYRMQITNGSEQPQHYRIRVRGLEGLAIVTADELVVEATGIGTLPLRLTLPPEGADAHRGRSHPIVFEVSTAQDGGEKTAQVKSTFLVPR
jgi:polyferredoxin